MVKKVKISEVFPNKENPRTISKRKLEKLVNSIKEFPEMLEKRPIIVDEDMIVLGGNMRLKACIEAGLKEVWIDVAEGWTEEQKMEFIVKDNVGFGDWDWGELAKWDEDKLINWGIDLVFLEGDKAEDEKDKERVLQEMEIKFNEHHDYLVFIFDDSNDWVSALSIFDVQKQPISLSPKIKTVGIGRVIDGRILLKKLSNED